MLAVSATAGGSSARLVRVTAHMVGLASWPTFDELHHGFFAEVDAIAILPDA